jgi:hypothetical protein
MEYNGLHPASSGEIPGAPAAVGTAYNRYADACNGLPLVFIPNRGQVHPRVAFYGEGSAYKVFFTPEEIVFSFTETAPGGDDSAAPFFSRAESCHDTDRAVAGLALYLKFIGANYTIPEGRLESGGKVNYFVGSDPANWLTGLPAYGEIVYRDLWPHIDLVFREQAGELKYEFIAHPNADINNIRLAYSGVEELVLDEDGNILIATPFGMLTDRKPIGYLNIDGEKVPVAINFALMQSETAANLFGFTVEDDYGSGYTLVIDPGLAPPPYPYQKSFSMATGIAVDNSGNTYITGFTDSPRFPVTPGAYQASLKGFKNAFVSVINTGATGAASLVYSTYLGGSHQDVGFGIAVDRNGNAYVTGFTESPDFPVTSGAYQASLKGFKNAFVSVINTGATGAASLVYSTYLGGSAYDEGHAIATDTAGNVYVTGYAQSGDFPVTPGAFQSALKSTPGSANAFVSKINTAAAGSASLVYSTYLGGSKYDQGYGIAVDASGNAYVTGFTLSPDFPVSSGAFQTALRSIHGGANAFVSKINTGATGTISLAYSTFLGGERYDEGRAVTLDTAGNAYVTGYTHSKKFPVTSNAYQPMLKSIYGGSNAFVSIVNTGRAGPSSLSYSTYLGGSISDAGNGIANDVSGNTYIAGRTQSPNFPITSGAFQPKMAGFMDAFVTELNTGASGSAALVYSTYLG